MPDTLIHRWHARHDFTCEESADILSKSATDREFYDGLNTVSVFLTGMVELWPAQALRIMILCVDHFLRDEGVNDTLRAARHVAMDRSVNDKGLRQTCGVLRRIRYKRKTFAEYHRVMLENILLWRLWTPAQPRTENMRYFGRIYVRLIQYLNKMNGAKNGNALVMAYLKQLLPFESWLVGIAESNKDDIDPNYRPALFGVGDA